jgi:phosphate transport system ATP-binding protein
MKTGFVLNENVRAEPSGENIKLRTENTSLYYGKFQALRNITLSIKERSIMAIIGPSGCGKSSFLRIFDRMNDLIPGARVEGKVEIDGNPIYGPTVDVVALRKKIGMVFQKPNPFPMSIYDNIAPGSMEYSVKATSTGLLKPVCSSRRCGKK